MERLAPTVRTPNREELRQLVERARGAGPIVSLYLDLDPSRFATPQARLSQVTSLIDDARRRAEDADLDHARREALKRDLETVRRTCERALPTDGAAGVAMFCSSASGLFDVLPLPRSVPAAIAIDDMPFIEPLAEYLDADHWCVALVNRSAMRVFSGDGDALEEVRAIRDVVHRKHSRGGWSQARYERSVEQDVQNHLARAAEDLFGYFEHAPFEHLLVGTLSELWPEVEAALHPYLRERVRGRVDVSVEHAALEDVRAVVQPVIEEHRRRRERALLDRLARELGTGGRAAAGSPDVLKMLQERRVETLLLGRGARGGERAVELAVEQSAEVVVVRHHDDLRRQDGIAALLRF